jgi:hypothetical protein
MNAYKRRIEQPDTIPHQQHPFPCAANPRSHQCNQPSTTKRSRTSKVLGNVLRKWANAYYRQCNELEAAVRMWWWWQWLELRRNGRRWMAWLATESGCRFPNLTGGVRIENYFGLGEATAEYELRTEPACFPLRNLNAVGTVKWKQKS